MSQPEVLKTDTFKQWNDKLNIISSNVGDGNILNTNNTNCVDGINELHDDIGDVDSLETDATSNCVVAINELNETLSGVVSFKVDLILGMS